MSIAYRTALSKHPLLGGSPEQIAQDLSRVQNLKVDEVFFSDRASPTVDDAVQRLEEIQALWRPVIS